MGLMEWIKSLTKEDIREIIAIATITSCFVFMFAIVFLPYYMELPEYAQRFADVILGYLFGKVLPMVMEYYFKNE